MRGSRFNAVIAVAALALLCSAGLTQMSAGAAPGSAAASGWVQPHATNELDCNGLSTKYEAVKAGLSGLCVDPKSMDEDGDAYRFADNGRYIGHDEPSVKFISSQPGSGNDMTYSMRLSRDPKAAPTANSPAASRYGELSIAPWFGLAMCDPNSFPLNPCTPDSDTNSGDFFNPQAAGSAFMELQFYPPGFEPFADAISCDKTKWCAALTIDSLECNRGFAKCNPACEEPQNFAYLQTNGVPTGPPGPALADINSYTPTARTLMMHDGDDLSVVMHDTNQGLLTEVDDRTTGQSGFMVASAANGFMTTNFKTCEGKPFSFHPEYDTAAAGNQVPWSSLESGVLMQQEIGHFEACSSVAHRLGSSSDGFDDPQVYQTCKGGAEGPHAVGEGPCNPATGSCQNATTEAGLPCPTNDFTTNALCEFSDANCMNAGSRPATLRGHSVVYDWPVAGCLDNAFQNGDLDFDGNSYLPDWPDGSPTHPTPFEYTGPLTRGQPYPSIQFETNVGGSEFFCHTDTGNGCTMPPRGAAFYPFWTLGRPSAGPLSAAGTAGGCVWNFGNVIPGTTKQAFGKTAQYGRPDVGFYAGNSISPVQANPQLTTTC